MKDPFESIKATMDKLTEFRKKHLEAYHKAKTSTEIRNSVPFLTEARTYILKTLADSSPEAISRATRRLDERIGYVNNVARMLEMHVEAPPTEPVEGYREMVRTMILCRGKLVGDHTWEVPALKNTKFHRINVVDFLEGGGSCASIPFYERSEAKDPLEDAPEFTPGTKTHLRSIPTDSNDFVGQKIPERKNSGTDGTYYDARVPVTDCDFSTGKIQCVDVIEALEMSFNRGEAFKSLWRYGKKEGESCQRSLEKVAFYALKMLGVIDPDKVIRKAEKRDVDIYNW